MEIDRGEKYTAANANHAGEQTNHEADTCGGSIPNRHITARELSCRQSQRWLKPEQSEE
jgi:hypothetical protein